MALPTLFRKQVIEGRSSGPHLLITGGVHGDEYEPIEAVRRLAEAFAGAGGSGPDLCGTLALVPVVNESAYALGTRVGEDGLDLARVCPGDSNGSLTERVAHELSSLIREADFYIDLHTGGGAFSVWPLSGYVLHADVSILEKQRRMARAFNLPVIWGTSAEHQGRSLSVARDAGVPAIYAEYLGGGICSLEGVRRYVDGCLDVMGELGMIVRPPAVRRIVHEIEDISAGSGHMQACHPAPVAGWFEPAVELGQEVGRGQHFGTISDKAADREHRVVVEQPGIVLVLRTAACVREGESLGVVANPDSAGGAP